jgi:hypothetical protein
MEEEGEELDEPEEKENDEEPDPHCLAFRVS